MYTFRRQPEYMQQSTWRCCIIWRYCKHTSYCLFRMCLTLLANVYPPLFYHFHSCIQQHLLFGLLNKHYSSQLSPMWSLQLANFGVLALTLVYSICASCEPLNLITAGIYQVLRDFFGFICFELFSKGLNDSPFEKSFTPIYQHEVIVSNFSMHLFQVCFSRHILPRYPAPSTHGRFSCL